MGKGSPAAVDSYVGCVNWHLLEGSSRIPLKQCGQVFLDYLPLTCLAFVCRLRFFHLPIPFVFWPMVLFNEHLLRSNGGKPIEISITHSWTEWNKTGNQVESWPSECSKPSSCWDKSQRVTRDPIEESCLCHPGITFNHSSKCMSFALSKLWIICSTLAVWSQLQWILSKNLGGHNKVFCLWGLMLPIRSLSS